MHVACMMERPALEQNNSKNCKSKIKTYTANVFVKDCMIAQARPSIMASVAHKAMAYLHNLQCIGPMTCKENSSENNTCTQACKEQAVMFFCHSKAFLTGLALRLGCAGFPLSLLLAVLHIDAR